MAIALKKWRLSGAGVLMLCLLLPACATENNVQTPSVPAPGDLTVTRFSSYAIRSLTWSDVSMEERSYELQWRFGDVEHWVALASVQGSGGQNEYGGNPGERLTVGNNAEYCYRIRAILVNAHSEWSDEVCADMSAGEPGPSNPWPPQPRGLVVTSPGGGGARLTWNPFGTTPIGDPLPSIWRRDKSAGFYETLTELEPGAVEFTDPGGSERFCYRVAARTQGISLGQDVCAS